MRYNPELSVVDERVFSISTVLAASTVTPGSTAPDPSLTVPVIDACARTIRGATITNAIANSHLPRAVIADILPPGRRPISRAATAAHRLIFHFRSFMQLVNDVKPCVNGKFRFRTPTYRRTSSDRIRSPGPQRPGERN